MVIISKILSKVVNYLEIKGITVKEITFEPVDLRFTYTKNPDKECLQSCVSFLEKYYLKKLQKGFKLRKIKVFPNVLDMTCSIPYREDFFQVYKNVRNVLISDEIEFTIRYEKS